jgi:predicted transcriptional regulator
MRDTRNRPEVSWLTKDFLIDVLRDLDVARSIEIKDHPDMDRGRRQVQRALNQLTDEGLVESSQQGRHVYYYVAGREDLLAARVGE